MRAATSITEFDTGPNARSVTHDVSDIILLIDALEKMSLRTDCENGNVVTTVSFG